MNTIKQFLSRWRILPEISYTNYRKEYGTHAKCFTSCFRVDRYWSEKIITIGVKHHAVTFDFRRSWVADMINPHR